MQIEISRIKVSKRKKENSQGMCLGQRGAIARESLHLQPKCAFNNSGKGTQLQDLKQVCFLKLHLYKQKTQDEHIFQVYRKREQMFY